METLFEQLIRRSSFRDGFYKNKILPKKYYKFPLCNINRVLNPDKKFFIDNDSYFRAPGATDQLKELGFDHHKTFDLSLVNSKQNKNIWNWVKSWHLKNPVAQIHNQQPGQMHLFHMDVVNSYKIYIPDPVEMEKKVKRVFVFLNDWTPGQVIMLGTKTISGWKRGDVLWFDWYNVPHGTANFSRSNRMMLQITGETTPEFEILLKK
jgi:hypothetical protein